MFKVTLVAILVFSASFSSSIVTINSLSDNSAKRSSHVDILKERFFFIEADEAFSKCACSIQYLHQLFAADRYLHAVICRRILLSE